MPHFRPHTLGRRRVLLPLLLALALVHLPGAGLAAAPQARFPDLPLALDPPSAKALGLGPGKTSLSGIPAQGLLVVVMSDFCPPCHLEVPRIKDLERRIRERGLAGRIRMVGLAVGDGQAQVERFLARHGGLPFPLLPDPALAAHKRLGSPVVPSLYVVGSQGGRLRQLALRQGEFTEDPDAFLDAVLPLLPAPPAKGP